MKFRLVLALSLAILLIGVASWSRFVPNLGRDTYIAVVEQPNNYDSYSEELVNDFTQPNQASEEEISNSAPVTEKSLTNTDIVSRNLILSYLTLASSGNVNDGTIDALANQYVEEALKAHIYEKASILDIKIVPDSSVNVNAYTSNLSTVYANLANGMAQITSRMQSSPTSYITFTGSAAKIYGDLASELKKIPVPISFSTLHLELLNIQLSNQAAMISAVNMEDDPITAIAGLTAVKENLEKEKNILNEISRNLKNKWDIIY